MSDSVVTDQLLAEPIVKQAARRWFVALPIIGELISHLSVLPPKLRPMVASDLHITIAYFGALNEAAAQAGFAATQLAFPAGAIAFGAIEPMADGERWSALAAQVPNETLALALGTARATALQAAGALPDTRPPRPHVTVARFMRRAKAQDREAALAWAQACNLEGVLARVDSLALYVSSDRSRDDGGRYDIVSRRSLSD